MWKKYQISPFYIWYVLVCYATKRYKIIQKTLLVSICIYVSYPTVYSVHLDHMSVIDEFAHRLPRSIELVKYTSTYVTFLISNILQFLSSLFANITSCYS